MAAASSFIGCVHDAFLSNREGEAGIVSLRLCLTQKFLVEACMQSFTKAGRQFVDAFVRYENDNVARGVEHSGTDFARLKMTLDAGAQLGIDLAVDVRRDVLPDVFAIDSHAPHPNRPLRLGANPFNSGASFFCKKARARCKRTLTAPSVIPSAALVSRTSISSMSLSSITLR